MKLIFETHYPNDFGPEVQRAIDEGKIDAPEQIRKLTNDGSAIITITDDPEHEGWGAIHVANFTALKRGQAHKSECPKRDALAAKIAVSFNSHEAMKEALEAFVDILTTIENTLGKEWAKNGDTLVPYSFLHKARAALALAEGK